MKDVLDDVLAHLTTLSPGVLAASRRALRASGLRGRLEKLIAGAVVAYALPDEADIDPGPAWAVYVRAGRRYRRLFVLHMVEASAPLEAEDVTYWFEADGVALQGPEVED